jgi:hypothetical protein
MRICAKVRLNRGPQEHSSQARRAATKQSKLGEEVAIRLWLVFLRGEKLLAEALSFRGIQKQRHFFNLFIVDGINSGPSARPDTR